MKIQSYVPILRTKRGEFTALKKMDDSHKKMFTPLFEIRKDRPDNKTLKNHLSNLAKQIAESWTDDTIIFDTPGLSEDEMVESSLSAIEHFYNELVAYDLNLVPTLTTDRSLGFCDKISKYSKKFLFRIQLDDTDTPQATIETIQSQIARLGVAKKNCSLLFDFKSLDSFNSDNLLDTISQITSEIGIEEWDSLIFAGCSFPEDMTGIKKHQAIRIERQEYSCWKALNNSRMLIGKHCMFGDYGIINPLKPEIDGMKIKQENISTKIRHACNGHWLIFRGDGFESKEEKYDEYQKLAHSMVSTRDFAGQNFSWGSECIFDCSNGKHRICGLEKWITIDMNHHICLTATQVKAEIEDLED